MSEHGIAQRDHLHVLDGLRGYAALLVVLYHGVMIFSAGEGRRYLDTPITMLTSSTELQFKILLTVLNGDLAVLVFFLLSGTVLIRSIERDIRQNATLSAGTAFSCKRFLRLYPPTLIAILSMAAILALWITAFGRPMSEYYFTAQNIVRNVLLIFPEVAGHTWTIMVELAATPFLVASGWALVRFGWYGLLPFVAIGFLSPFYPWLAFDYVFMPDYLIAFALGCLLPYQPGQSFAKLGARVGLLLPVCVLIGIRFFVETIPVQSIICAIVLATLIHQPRERWTRVLSAPISRFFGRISFGIYLWHYPLTVMASLPGILYFQDIIALSPPLIGLMCAIPIILITIPLAMLSERLVERPCIRGGYALARLIRGRVAPTPVIATQRHQADLQQRQL